MKGWSRQIIVVMGLGRDYVIFWVNMSSHISLYISVTYIKAAVGSIRDSRFVKKEQKKAGF